MTIHIRLIFGLFITIYVAAKIVISKLHCEKLPVSSPTVDHLLDFLSLSTFGNLP